MRTLLMPQKYFKRLDNSQGNTILGVLCLIALSVAAFQICLSNSMSVNGGIKSSRILSARDALEARIKSYSSMGTTFRSSMYLGVPLTVNTELRNCVFGTGPNPCNGKPDVKTPVALYYPLLYSESGASSATLRRISGPGKDDLSPSESAFYDNKGNLCIANSDGSIEPNCPFFEVTTTFTAKCAVGDSCTTAESISINYVIKTATTLSGSAAQTLGGFSMATIELAARDVSLSEILPAAAGSSSTNVTISLLATPSTTSLESIKTALLAAGVPNDPNLEKYALAFQQSGINDLSKIPFLVKVGQPDPTWMRLIVDSGITNEFLAYELFWSGLEWTPASLAATAAAVADIKIPEVAYAIAETMVTDAAVAKQMADAVAGVANPNVAAGIIAGGYYTDPAKVLKIASAVSQIPDPTAEYLAKVGVTDPNIASQIAEIVSVVEDRWGAGWIIVAGGGDVAKTQYALEEALKSTSTPDTPATTTTTTTTQPGTPSALPPVEISLMPTCSTCSPVTY